MVPIAATLLFLLCQQDRTALRTEKADYFPAIQKCKDGEGMIDSDPKTAIEKFDEVVNNPKLKWIECRLRVEERPSEYTAYYAFLPFQYRGRAKINLAKKSDPDIAQKLLNEAVADLQRSAKEGVVEGSLKEGVKSSDEFLKAAKADLEAVVAKIKAASVPKTAGPAAVEPAIVKFRPAFLRLLDDLKFKAARDFIESEGKGLTDAEKKRFRDDAEAGCRTYLGEQALKLRRRITSDIRSIQDLQSLSAGELDASFAVPRPDDLVATHPAIEWARASLAAFEGVRSRKNPAESLLAAAAAAIAVEPDGENQWFGTAMTVAFQGMRESVRGCVDRARDALLPERQKERTAADDLVKKWTDFAAKLDPKFRDAHPSVAAHGKELAQLLAGFPVDLADVDKADLDACFAAASPEAALASIEKSLKGLESGKTVTRESRRKLYHLLFTATALRALVEGKTEDAAAAEAEAYGLELVKAGGPVETKKYGPRMEAVFSKLR
ncbi:MAG TPA: hypothetical protein VJB14_01845 [Planctomycetota bacterium]|nr:hypothetical protein [Planctomycetota bacterium]